MTRFAWIESPQSVQFGCRGEIDEGKMLGFDFARDPLNSKRPMQPAEEITKADIADKPKVTAAQRKLLEQRYDLTPRVDP